MKVRVNPSLFRYHIEKSGKTITAIDGAVIIRDNTIVCAKAYYPSTERTDLPLKFGTRHRAAIGISEQSDALTIVISEETGFVSVTINRQIDYNVSKETLNLYFEKYLKIK